jgi:hypothetical protein
MAMNYARLGLIVRSYTFQCISSFIFPSVFQNLLAQTFCIAVLVLVLHFLTSACAMQPINSVGSNLPQQQQQ